MTVKDLIADLLTPPATTRSVSALTIRERIDAAMKTLLVALPDCAAEADRGVVVTYSYGREYAAEVISVGLDDDIATIWIGEFGGEDGDTEDDEE